SDMAVKCPNVGFVWLANLEVELARCVRLLVASAGADLIIVVNLHRAIPFCSEAPSIGAFTVCDRRRERRQRSVHAKRKTEAPAGKPSWQLARAGCGFSITGL